jgi:NADH-ubiquinone oxidoreductase chain 5
LFIGFGTDFWGSALFISPFNYVLSDIEFIDLKFKILPLLVTLLGASFSFYIYKYSTSEYFSIKKTALFRIFYHFFNKKWYFDRLYNEIITQRVLNFSYNYFYKMIDRGIIEKWGPFGIVGAINTISVKIKTTQTGFVLKYLQFILFFLISCFFTYSFLGLNVFYSCIFYTFLSIFLIWRYKI